MTAETIAQTESETTSDNSWRGRAISAGILGSIHTAIYTWTYFAWYRPRAKTEELIFLDEGWFGPTTYAGGADKLGHFFANYAFTRGTVSLLEAGGWSRRQSMAASTALTLAFFTVIEFKDGYHEGFGFSQQDMVANLAGVGVGALMTEWEALDRAIDIRIQYFPTQEFVDQLVNDGVVDAAEDYSGQAFVVAHHLGSIGPLRRSDYFGWTRYLDVVAGYRAVNYKPTPTEPGNPRQQELYFGLTLNMQEIFNTWSRSTRRKSPTWSKVLGTTGSFFEYFQVPFTTLKLVDFDRDNGELPLEMESAGLRR